jgi:hypothetical protein
VRVIGKELCGGGGGGGGGYFRSLWTFFIYISDTLFGINNGKNYLSLTNGAWYVI